jgi:hypothetical protein
MEIDFILNGVTLRNISVQNSFVRVQIDVRKS